MDYEYQRLLHQYAASGDPEIAVKIANLALRVDREVLPSYLAIGIAYENALSFSRCVENIENPQHVYNFLARESDISVWEDILIIQNENDCPSVLHHWSEGKDFSNSTLPELVSAPEPIKFNIAPVAPWHYTFETHDLHLLQQTPWQWNINEEDGIASVDLSLGVHLPNPLGVPRGDLPSDNWPGWAQIDAAIVVLFQTLRDNHYIVDGE